MKSNSIIALSITIGILLALSLLINNNLSFYGKNGYKSTEYSTEINLDNKNLKISKISGKIHIINNSGWVDFKNDGNCTGSGTYSDPYVIKDLIIDGGGSGNCITIEYSNVYFKIENNILFNSDVGIKLHHVENGILVDNNCTLNSNGIYSWDSDNNIILENAINENSEGIFLSYSNKNIISGNNASYNDIGICCVG
ncbi:MAG: NosD domain-containing protein, partial [Promethearchaeota archaeon]